jgi:peptidoglycan/xylan/chitin deacetylase (PgdA/CDA1 family)
MRGHLLVDVPMAAAAISLYPAYGLEPLAWLAGASFLIHTWGVVNPRSSLYLPVHWRLPRGCPGLALTFDDGPDPETTPRILDCLAEHRQQATFFLIGEHVRRHGALVRRMVAEGHAVGLHSFSHSRLVNLWPPWLVQRDLEQCGRAISDACGAPAPRLYRPVVGLKNPVIGFVAGRLQLCAVTWSCRALDTGASDPESVLARLRRGLMARAILVMHDGCEPRRMHDRTVAVTVLRRLLPELRARGLSSGALVADGRAIGLRLHPQAGAAALAVAAGGAGGAGGAPS